MEANTFLKENLPSAWVKRIFEVMHVTYGETFTRKWSGVDAGLMTEFWGRSLAGYTSEEIKRGIENLPPNFPPDVQSFKALCRPILSPEAAYHEAIHQLSKRASGEDVWDEPAIFWAATEYGQSDLRQSNWMIARDRWKLFLDKARQDNRLDVPKAQLALAAPDDEATLPPKQVLDRIRSLGYKLDLKRVVTEAEV